MKLAHRGYDTATNPERWIDPFGASNVASDPPRAARSIYEGISDRTKAFLSDPYEAGAETAVDLFPMALAPEAEVSELSTGRAAASGAVRSGASAARELRELPLSVLQRVRGGSLIRRYVVNRDAPFIVEAETQLVSRGLEGAWFRDMEALASNPRGCGGVPMNPAIPAGRWVWNTEWGQITYSVYNEAVVIRDIQVNPP
jgi:hypothetical protein